MSALPRGQRAIDDFPRFGLQQYQYRFPHQIDRVAFEVTGDVESALSVEKRFSELTRTEQVSDLHCVTTWSRCRLAWAGVRFRDFCEQLVLPEVRPEPQARLVVFRGQDGNRASLPLDDLLAADVLLADTLDGEPLSIAHHASIGRSTSALLRSRLRPCMLLPGGCDQLPRTGPFSLVPRRFDRMRLIGPSPGTQLDFPIDRRRAPARR